MRRHARAVCRGLGLAAGLGVLLARGGAAAEPGAPPERPPFERGTQQVAGLVGYSGGVHIRDASNGDLGDTDFVAVAPQWGVGLTDPLASEHWYGGSLAVLVEGTFLLQTQPHDGLAGGAALLLRYHFLGAGRLVPFLELGGGGVALDFDREADGQADGFNFTLQAGLGAHWFLTDRLALTGAWRYHHISNADLDEPNDGIDSSLFLVGVSFFFR